MIIVYLNFWQKIKLLFGWYVQIELWPSNAQSYSQYTLPPWEEKRVFRSYEHKAAAARPTGENGAGE